MQMIGDAIVTLKDKSGSSQYAITKFIEDKQKNLPPNFRKLLLVQLKKFVANGKLIKVKSSFKLAPASASAPAKKDVAPEAKPKAKAPVSKGKKVTVSKAKPVAKAAAAKPKSAAAAKSKPAAKRKATEKPKSEKLPVKAAKTSTRSTPRRTTAVTPPAKKASAAKKTVPSKKAPAKKTPVKIVKLKTIKSPAKKAVAKKGKK